MRSILLFLVLFAGVKAFTILDENSERYGNNTDLLVAENEDCRCENGRCVTDKRGKMKCACNPKHSPTDDETCKPCDCGNKGKCIFQMKLQDGIVQYKKLCVCDKGSAEKDGVCVDCQCGQNSLCEFEGEEKLCYCEDGYSEKHGVCTKCDCGENSEDCKFEGSEKVCHCKEGFAQREDGTCRVPCKESCFNYGECKGNGKHKFCDCKKGTSGDLCETVDDCLQQDFCGLKTDVKCVYNETKNGGDCKCIDASKLFNPVTKKCEIPCHNNCANGGECNRHGDRSFCVCKPGTSGDLCDIVDDCTKKGFCGYKGDVKCVYNGISGGQCVCDDRRKKFDAQSGKCGIPCEGNCNNGGQCVTVGNARFCSCKEGTSGDLCEIVDDCNKVNFCGRKDDVRCVYDGRKGGTCVCKDNDKSFNSAAKECRKQCRDSDCKNEGKCYSQGDLNFCSCKPGTSGDHCEIIKECIKGGSLEKCEEGNGKCIFVNGAAKCKCPLGQEFDKTKGKCRKQCYGSDCKNEGNCKYHGEFDFCACKEGTSGDHCEIINDCVKGGSLEGCEEGNGKCIFVNGAAKCVCPTGEEFDKVQRRCRIPCHNNCANGGTCNRHGDQSFCVCKPGTSGDLCNIVDDCTKKGFCGYKRDVKCVYNGISGGQCVCDDRRKKFDAQSGKCRIPCQDNCANGGACNRHGDQSFCVCKPGTSGDLCDIVDDCTKKGFCGYKGDVKCVYNGISGGQCVCDDRRKKFDAHSGKCRRTCINNDDCGKGGNCLGKMSSPAYCECHEGYEGDLCEVVTGCKELGDKCAKAGGTCVFDSREESKASCLCKKENHVYDRVTEKCHPICINKTDCGVGGSCVDGKFCYCKDGYEGVGCSIVTGCKELGRKCDLAGALCVFDEKAANKARCQCIKDKHVYDPISGSCKPSCNEKGDCGIGGTCVNGKYCDCKDGFEGVGCDVITGCKDGLGEKCSRGGGKCVFDDSSINKAKCLCNKEKHLYDKQSGRCIWSCENDNDCHHGSKCSPGSGGFNSCHCPPGTSGDKCDVVDDCETGRLKNCRGKNGSCSFDIKKGISVCKCGKDQRFDIVKNICRDRTCTEATCRNGRCEDVGNTEVCKCYEGFAMTDGECRKLKCTKTPCIGGECIVRHGNIEECVCPAGFALHKGKCRRGTCRVGTCFGGRCETIQGELICVCPRGYHLIGIGCHGTQCQKKRCFGGVCKVVEDTEEEICTCYEGYELIGDVCQLKLCKHKSCFGGQCHIVDGKEECSCPSGYILYDDVCRLNRL